ncbi:MAG: hypothetical protein QM737_02580 [Ferruginibacter sp.]
MIKLKAIPVIENNNKIDGFHLIWNPFLHGHLPLSGYTIFRRKSGRNNKKPVCRLIDGTAINSLHNSHYLVFTGTDIIFDKILFNIVTDEKGIWKEKIRKEFPFPVTGPSPDFPVYSYDAHFTEAIFNVHISIAIKPPLPFVMAIGSRDGKVVASKIQKTSLDFHFTDAVDNVRFYLLAKTETIRVCYTVPDYGKAEDWQLLQKNLCMPFTGFSSGVHNTQEEFELFKSRIKDGSTPNLAEFEKISTLIKNAAEFSKPLLLPYTSIMEYLLPNGMTDTGNINMNTAPFAMLQLFSIYHNWRMGLGFGYLDQYNLEKDALYDYKIIASFHKNVKEKIYDFHTVPVNTGIGPCFALAGIFFFVHTRTIVKGFPGLSGSSDTNPFIKGIRIQGRVRIIFPEPTKKFALYCVNDPGAAIRVGTSFTTIPVTHRTEIVLGSYETNVLLHGDFILTGIAYVSLDAGDDPAEKTDIVGYSFNNPYVNTDRPKPPTFLDAINTQKPWIPSEHQAPEGLGFILKWQQPSTAAEAIDPDVWPPDSPIPPLPELAYYKLEYRNISSSSPLVWHYYDEKTVDFPNGTVVHSDGYTADPLPVNYGCDLLNVFPAGNPPGGTYSLIQRYKHLLNDLKRSLKAVPGDIYQYRISSVDLTGRNSLTVTESPEVRLEKWQPPPPPAGIIEKYLQPVKDPGYSLPDPRTDLRPQHVYARVLQASSKGLTLAERELLGDNDHLTILTWTWGEEEIKMDPSAKEFRVYFRSNEHGLIRGITAMDAVASGDKWKVDAILSREINIDEFAGVYMTINKVPFRIVSHDAGLTVSFIVASPRTSPGKIPQAGSFQLHRKSSGEDARPLSWDQRIAVIPVRPHSIYQYVLEKGILLSEPAVAVGIPGINYDITPEGKNARCWLGVSAADNESYVSDQLTSASAYSPKAGNESAIVTAVVSAKYSGRPEFNPPPPLEDVPVAILDEARSDELLLNITPSELMPFLEPHNRLRVERISGTDILSLLHIETSSIQLSDAENPVIVTDWELNPADDAELRNAFHSRSKPIPAKFIWAISKRNDIHLDRLWKQVNPQPVLCTEPLTDLLPNRAERYIYRTKIVNAIGVPSERAAFFPNVWRAPDKTVPATVIISSIETITEEADTIVVSPVIKMNAAAAATAKGILVFATAFPSSENLTADQLTNAALLKIPNRPDFMSEQLYRVRAMNQLVEPLFVPIAESAKESSNDIITLVWKNTRFNFSYDNDIVMWAAAVSNDNILSPLSSFKKKFTGLTPPVAPGLILDTSGSGIDISFDAISIDGFFYRIERSNESAEKGFEPVSPWFKASAGTSTKHFNIPVTETWFRLKIKNINNREYTGIPIQYNP